MTDNAAEVVARYIAYADLMRYHDLDHLTQAEIARRVGVNRSSVLRRMAVLKEALPLVEDIKQAILEGESS